ncbi:MAG TPA: helix-turn-helix domain-containing protein [Terriglobales bacterium]|nr:helix-turn-helix domain-containing protein [Terriglobales bacterium]
MPRKPDANVESRILDAAFRLWSERGERALTMRAVARAARTTTPTLYQRFHDKNDLRNFLVERARQNLFNAVQPADSSLELLRRALEFISGHGNEYRLLTYGWAQRLASGAPMLSLEFLQKLLAEELGGSAASHKQLALQLVALVHGTALLLPPSDEKSKIVEGFHKLCLEACSQLIANARSRPNSRPAKSA